MYKYNGGLQMLSMRQCTVCLSAIMLFASLSVGSDLVSVRHAYDEKDYATALREVTPLAEQGNAEAQFLLGKMYMRGQGVPADNDQAMKWLKASGSQGNAEAQFFVGSIYLLPHKDIPEGVKWLRLSAEQGNQDAQLFLGKAYMDGSWSIVRDPVQGEMWLRLAAKDNLPFYEAQLADAEKQMSPQQVEKGKALAAAWKAKSGLTP